jgi:CDGSH-type Zn-finger protein
VTITPLTNGPLSVVGTVGITQPDGTVEVAARWELCRCGHSGSKPACDGSHARVGFIAPGAPKPPR